MTRAGVPLALATLGAAGIAQVAATSIARPRATGLLTVATLALAFAVAAALTAWTIAVLGARSRTR